MTSTGRAPGGAGRFVRGALTWAVAVAAAWAVTATIVSVGGWPLSDFIEICAMAIAFSAFAGGVACPWSEGRPRWEFWSTVGAAVVLGFAVWLLLAWVAPFVEVWIRSVVGTDSRLMNSPLTPSALRGIRAVILENPGLDVDPRPSSSDPFLWAPNWVDYKLSRPRTAGFLTLVNSGLGILCATLSTDLRPGLRRRIRWGAGLLSAFVYIAADGAAASVLAVDPDASAILWSALTVAPHLVALTLLGIAVWIVTRDRRGAFPGRRS